MMFVFPDESPRLENQIGGVMLALMLTTTVFCVGEVNEQAGTTLEDIFRVWRARELHVKTARFAWTETVTIGQGTMLPNKRAGGKESNDPSLLPKEDFTFAVQNWLRFDDKRMYYSTEGMLWIREREAFEQRKYVSVYDGAETGKVFYDGAGDDYSNAPTGLLNTATQNQDVENNSLQAFLMAYRPFHPGMGRFRESEWKMSGKAVAHNGSQCVVIERADGLLGERCWLDPSRDFMVVRFFRTWGDKPTLEITFQYQQDEAHEWVPAGWSSMLIYPQSSQLARCSRATVTECFINQPLNDQELDFEFPPSTWVTDRSQTGEGKPIQYIVLPNGDKRLITSEEKKRGATYQQLLETESGMAGLPPSRRFLWALLPIVLLLGIVAWKGWKKWGRRNEPHGAM